ncbi:hypothetical protein [Hyphomicrobium sulfonivorans]|uniref:hypothetical protein n=1 Tax=Hyphomicrobium sulfonivorans TaxID=121290 RepID=UPI0012EE2E57|nr:hypothetical protein [Hyphomicrobium sulfonivorans]
MSDLRRAWSARRRFALGITALPKKQECNAPIPSFQRRVFFDLAFRSQDDLHFSGPVLLLV